MFKFRRDSLCTGVEGDVIGAALEGIEQEQEQSAASLDVTEDILEDSISGSRLPSSLYGDWDEKESNENDESESSSDSLTTSSEHSSPPTSVPWTTNTSSENKANDKPLTMGITSNILLDRKRKERNESWCSQEQETKLIRASEPEVQAVLKSIQDHDKIASSGSSCNNSDTNAEKAEIESTSLNLSTSTDTDEDSAFGKSVPIPQRELGFGMRTMPMHFEPEAQRQWERTAAQWNSRKTRRTHRPRHSRSSKSFSEVEEVIKKNHRNFEELSISTSERFSSVSVSLLEEESLEESVELNLDIIQDSPEEYDTSGMMSNSNVMEPLQSLDFTTLHHQVESDEPVSYSAAIHSRSDLAMLSPRSSIVFVGDLDSNVAPSPPLHQFLLDPPISKQILNANQEMKMNSLSRQISNQKKQLKRLEEEHAKIFGGNLSYADKLKHSEMSKCINQLSKAKRAMKQIREDPSSFRSGSQAGMRESIRSLSASFAPPKLVTSESLKQLEATVALAERKLKESRKSQNRPDDLFVMTASELKDEKDAIQKQLVFLEKLHGRPERGEKGVVRILYDRYRALKRITGRATTVKENSLDLAPILEHEALDLSREETVIRKPGCSIVELKKGFNMSPKSQRRHLGVVTADDRSEVTGKNLKKNEDFNDMDLKELRARLSVFDIDRHELRGSIRALESAYAASNGRVLKKGEKCPGAEVEGLYQQYKHVRATIRLLRILIDKANKLPGLLEGAERIQD